MFGSKKKRKAAEHAAAFEELVALHARVTADADAAREWLQHAYPMLTEALTLGMAGVAAAQKQVDIFNACMADGGFATRIEPVVVPAG